MRPIPARRRHRPTALLLLAGLLAAVVLTGCAGDDSGSSETTSDSAGGVARSDADMAEATAGEQAEAPDEGSVSDDGEPTTSGAGDGDGRAVIRTGTMHLRATDTADVAERVVEVVEDAGGYVAGTDLSRDSDGVIAGTFTFRVPSAELQATMDAFDALADAVPERRLDEVDVTTELTDLEAELTNLEAYEAELRELLTEVREDSEDTEDLLRVFDRVNSVRAQIDQANARRMQLTDQVAMSTIHLRLSPTASTGPVANPSWDPGGTARAALATTVRALTELADTLIRIGLTVLPITLVLVAPFLIVGLVARAWWRRRRGAGAKGSPEPVGSQAGPTPPPAPNPDH